MPLNTLRKESPNIFEFAARLASSLFILTMRTRVTDSSVLIATTCKRKTNVSSYHLKLTKVSCYSTCTCNKSKKLIGYLQ